ncbi:MAG: head maturation protease, ClpP-related, partial [Phycicoccus sp.]
MPGERDRPQQYRFRGASPPSPTAADQGVVVDQDGSVTLRVYEPIDSWGGSWGLSAAEFAAALDTVPAGTPRITLRVNSPGGEVWEGIAIANLLRAHPARVTAVVDGVAASAASFIAVAADELIMGANTELMIHDAWGIALGPAEAMRDAAARLDAVSDNIASIYQRKAGGTVADWRALMLAETWYSADEAVAAGLADSVADTPAEDAAKARAKVD